MGEWPRNDEATRALRERLPDAGVLAELLPLLQRLAEPHPGVFLVGGPVRDLLLGIDSVDLDLAVEGDPLGFARALAEGLGTDAREHEHFGTAVVRAGAIEIDIAGTRRETYEGPGSLPTVSAAGLGEDLARRDFTINAMAASLKHEDFGAVCDPHGGLADLRAGVVRVLHERSFIDDPTRLLRACRYAARFGFALDVATADLARAATAEGGLGAIDSRRVRDELVDLLSEPAVEAALVLARDLGVGPALHPGLALDSGAIELAGRLDDWRARLAALCESAPPIDLSAWMDRLKFSSAERDAVAGAAANARRLSQELLPLGDPPASALARLLAGAGETTLSVAAAHSPVAARLVDRYRREVMPVRLEISGADLIAAGVPEGPTIGRALDAVLMKKLDGEVTRREDQLEAALELALRPAD